MLSRRASSCRPPPAFRVRPWFSGPSPVSIYTSHHGRPAAPFSPRLRTFSLPRCSPVLSPPPPPVATVSLMCGPQPVSSGPLPCALSGRSLPLLSLLFPGLGRPLSPWLMSNAPAYFSPRPPLQQFPCTFIKAGRGRSTASPDSNSLRPSAFDSVSLLTAPVPGAICRLACSRTLSYLPSSPVGLPPASPFCCPPPLEAASQRPTHAPCTASEAISVLPRGQFRQPPPVNLGPRFTAYPTALPPAPLLLAWLLLDWYPPLPGQPPWACMPNLNGLSPRSNPLQ